MSTPADQVPEERGHGIRIASVAGIPVYLTPSWFVIAAVIVFFVAQPVLRTDPLFGIGLGVLQAALLLLSVLVHEVAHAIAARSLGMPVLRIVANLWGGHTSFQTVRPSPGPMALVALAGPAANLVLAGAAFVGWVTSGDGLVHSVFQGLLIINGTLAAFNVVPALPLDGGAALESVVWWVTGKRHRGTLVAGWSGRVLAVVVVLWFSVRPLLRGGANSVVDLVWGLVIASVLWTGASAAIRRGTAWSSLGRLRVADVSEPVVVLPPSTPVAVASAHPDLVLTTDDRGLPLLYLLGATPAGVDPSTPLVSVVTRLPDESLVPASPDDPLDAVLTAMGTGTAYVVLTDGGRPWGVTSVDRINAAAARN